MTRQTQSRFGLLRRAQIVPLAFLFAIVLGCGTGGHVAADGQDEWPPGGFLARLTAEEDSLERLRIVDRFAEESRQREQPYTLDSEVFLWYRGPAQLVTVPSDLNRWNPGADTMHREEKTDFFHITIDFDPAGRFEYKLFVDSAWLLDPANPRTIHGGFGSNSEVRMAEYVPPVEIKYRRNIPHGTMDTLVFNSSVLQRSHPVYIYLPYDYDVTAQHPTLYVADGADYLSRASMKDILDNLISEGRIPGIVVVFLDPRTDPSRPETNMRMVDYGISDDFNTYLAMELRDTLMSLYSLHPEPQNTAVMGASLGGLAATYAALQRDDVFGLCGVQSPAYQWKNDTLLTMITASPAKDVTFYVTTGTVHDAAERCRVMTGILSEKGYRFRYTEHPEGHNWANWQARISDILTFFWGTQ
ncbi:MAG: alpha/beta hydrolase-fold protein [Bacteroidota bacterium]